MGNKLKETIKELIKQPITRVMIIIAVLSIFGSAGWVLAKTQQVPEQPIEFPHNRHVGLGVQCLYCHPGAWKSETAGLPTQNKCWGCHQQITKQSEQLDILKEYINSGEPIQWVPVAIMPDFVKFNHRPHIAYGLNCETCHGEVGEMIVAEPQPGFNMGWCLDCHIEKSGDNQEMFTKLTDCFTCHH